MLRSWLKWVGDSMDMSTTHKQLESKSQLFRVPSTEKQPKLLNAINLAVFVLYCMSTELKKMTRRAKVYISLAQWTDLKLWIYNRNNEIKFFLGDIFLL